MSRASKRDKTWREHLAANQSHKTDSIWKCAKKSIRQNKTAVSEKMLEEKMQKAAGASRDDGSCKKKKKFSSNPDSQLRRSQFSSEKSPRICKDDRNSSLRDRKKHEKSGEDMRNHMPTFKALKEKKEKYRIEREDTTKEIFGQKKKKYYELLTPRSPKSNVRQRNEQSATQMSSNDDHEKRHAPISYHSHRRTIKSHEITKSQGFKTQVFQVSEKPTRTKLHHKSGIFGSSKSYQETDVSLGKILTESQSNNPSGATAPPRMRNLKFVKTSVIDDKTYVVPEDDPSQDFVIIPYCPRTGVGVSNAHRRKEDCLHKSKEFYKSFESRNCIEDSKVILEDAQSLESPINDHAKGTGSIYRPEEIEHLLRKSNGCFSHSKPGPACQSNAHFGQSQENKQQIAPHSRESFKKHESRRIELARLKQMESRQNEELSDSRSLNSPVSTLRIQSEIKEARSYSRCTSITRNKTYSGGSPIDSRTISYSEQKLMQTSTMQVPQAPDDDGFTRTHELNPDSVKELMPTDNSCNFGLQDQGTMTNPAQHNERHLLNISSTITESLTVASSQNKYNSPPFHQHDQRRTSVSRTKSAEIGLNLRRHRSLQNSQSDQHHWLTAFEFESDSATMSPHERVDLTQGSGFQRYEEKTRFNSVGDSKGWGDSFKKLESYKESPPSSAELESRHHERWSSCASESCMKSPIGKNHSSRALYDNRFSKKERELESIEVKRETFFTCLNKSIERIQRRRLDTHDFRDPQGNRESSLGTNTKAVSYNDDLTSSLSSETKRLDGHRIPDNLHNTNEESQSKRPCAGVDRLRKYLGHASVQSCQNQPQDEEIPRSLGAPAHLECPTLFYTAETSPENINIARQTQELENGHLQTTDRNDNVAQGTTSMPEVHKTPRRRTQPHEVHPKQTSKHELLNLRYPKIFSYAKPATQRTSKSTTMTSVSVKCKQDHSKSSTGQDSEGYSPPHQESVHKSEQQVKEFPVPEVDVCFHRERPKNEQNEECKDFGHMRLLPHTFDHETFDKRTSNLNHTDDIPDFEKKLDSAPFELKMPAESSSHQTELSKKYEKDDSSSRDSSESYNPKIDVNLLTSASIQFKQPQDSREMNVETTSTDFSPDFQAKTAVAPSGKLKEETTRSDCNSAPHQSDQSLRSARIPSHDLKRNSNEPPPPPDVSEKLSQIQTSGSTTSEELTKDHSMNHLTTTASYNNQGYDRDSGHREGSGNGPLLFSLELNNCSPEVSFEKKSEKVENDDESVDGQETKGSQIISTDATDSNVNTFDEKDEEHSKFKTDLKSHTPTEKELLKNRPNEESNSISPTPIKMEQDGSNPSSHDKFHLYEALEEHPQLDGTDPNLQDYIVYLQNRLEDCKRKVQEQITIGNEQQKQDSQQNDLKQEGADLTIHSHVINNIELEQLTLESTKRAEESKLEVCNCRHSEVMDGESTSTSSDSSDIPPFQGCECMREDYYKIMRLAYNK